MTTAGIPACRPATSRDKSARWLPLLAVAALAACSTTARVDSDYDKASQISSFQKFTLIVRPHPSMHSSAPVEQRMYDAIRQELTAKGFTYVPDLAEADFAVDFSVGGQDRLVVNSIPHYVRSFSPAGWGAQLDGYEYEEGTLAIDVIALKSRKVVWHASAKKELSQAEMSPSEEPIREAVTPVLAGFPPPLNLPSHAEAIAAILVHLPPPPAW
jgi:hypothetical protein